MKKYSKHYVRKAKRRNDFRSKCSGCALTFSLIILIKINAKCFFGEKCLCLHSAFIDKRINSKHSGVFGCSSQILIINATATENILENGYILQVSSATRKVDFHILKQSDNLKFH